MNNRIHVVAFQQPYPPSYGGAIDMYFRIKALHDAGVDVVLHTFCYGDRSQHAEELEKITGKVYYYERQTGWKSQFSLLPYIVRSRKNQQLLENLCQDDAPILFEGLHTTFYLNHKRLRNRFKIVRAHNIEHNYYRALACSPGNISDRIFFAIESCKLRIYERRLRYADLIAPLNYKETEHFKKRYHNVQVHFSPVFFDEKPAPVSGSGNYVLYHGNLTVAENVKAAKWIIDKITSAMADVHFVIAGFQLPHLLMEAVSTRKNVELVNSPSDRELAQIVDKARVHLLITFQSTGVKLKLLNVLHRRGRVVANPLMVEGTGLEGFCNVGDTPEALTDLIRRQLSTDDFPQSLPPHYNSRNNIIGLLSQVPYYRDFLKCVPRANNRNISDPS